MKRRTLLKAGAVGGVALAAPSITRAAGTDRLLFVPQAGLAQLDPVFTSAYVTRNHAFLVFDTLYGLDTTRGGPVENSPPSRLGYQRIHLRQALGGRGDRQIDVHGLRSCGWNAESMRWGFPNRVKIESMDDRQGWEPVDADEDD